jgi:hypothetical protein
MIGVKCGVSAEAQHWNVWQALIATLTNHEVHTALSVSWTAEKLQAVQVDLCSVKLVSGSFRCMVRYLISRYLIN